MQEKSIASLQTSTRFIVIGIFACTPRYKNAQRCLTGKRVQKVSRQADFTSRSIFQLATRVARRSGKIKKKETPEPLDHTRTALENDRSIDREEHATISTPDLLALVQLGEICENVCATIGSGPTLRFRRRGRLLVSNRVSIKNLCSCHERLHRCPPLSTSKTRRLGISSRVKASRDKYKTN